MILKFDDYINEKYLEGYYAPLYHFTSIFNLLYIFLRGSILRSSYYGNISFTRDKNFFKVNRIGNIQIDSKQVRIEIDTEKVKQNYKLKPFNYFKRPFTTQIEKDESEEILKENLPVKYIKSITINTKYVKSMYNAFFDADIDLLYSNNILKYHKNITKNMRDTFPEYLKIDDIKLIFEQLCYEHNIKLIIL